MLTEKEYNTLNSKIDRLLLLLEKDKLTSFNAEEAARYIGREKKTLYNLKAKGLIRGQRQGKLLVFQKSELDRYLDSLKDSSSSVR